MIFFPRSFSALTVTFMLAPILKLYFLEKKRVKEHSRIVRMFEILFYLFVCIQIITLGYFTPELLNAVDSNKSACYSIVNLSVYFFLVNIVLRFFFQGSTNSIFNALIAFHLKKNNLAKCILIFDFLNIPNLFFFLYSISVSFHFFPVNYLLGLNALLVLLALLVISNLTIVFIKRYSIYKNLFVALSLPSFFLIYFFRPLPNDGILGYYISICLVWIIALAWINFNEIKKNLFVDLSEKRFHRNSGSILSFGRYLTKNEDVALLFDLEIKLIFRNRRPRQIILISFILYIYLLILCSTPLYSESTLSLVFFGIMITGMWIVNYGQFLHSWHSCHFDFFLIKNLSFESYLESKRLLFAVFGFIMFFFSMAFSILLGPKAILLNFASVIFNFGVTSYLVLFFANRNYSSINLQNSYMLNFEGVNSKQYLLTFLVIAVPLCLFLLFELFGNSLGVLSIGVVGALGVVLNNVWIVKIKDGFNKRRYRIAHGFRNS